MGARKGVGLKPSHADNRLIRHDEGSSVRRPASRVPWVLAGLEPPPSRVGPVRAIIVSARVDKRSKFPIRYGILADQKRTVVGVHSNPVRKIGGSIETWISNKPHYLADFNALRWRTHSLIQHIHQGSDHTLFQRA
jgi:hypothetical protein